MSLFGCTKQEKVDQTTDVTSSTQEQTFKGTIEDLLKKGDKMTCTVDMSMQGVETKWIYYFDGKTMKNEVSMNIGGQKMNTYTLIKDGYIYVRKDGSSQGMKFPYEEISEGEGSATNTSTKDILGADMMDFSCTKGIQDTSVFTIPQNITFPDMKQRGM